MIASFCFGAAFGIYTSSRRTHLAWEESNKRIFKSWEAQIGSRINKELLDLTYTDGEKR